MKKNENKKNRFFALDLESGFNIQFYTLKFPQKLFLYVQKIAERKATEESGEYKRFYNLKLKNLDRYIRSFFSDIIYVSEINTRMLDEPFIYSIKSFELEKLKSIISIWFNNEYNETIPEELLREFDWQKQDIDIDYEVNKFGTAMPNNGKIMFNLLPNFIAYKLSGVEQEINLSFSIGKTKKRYYSGNYTFKFQRVLTTRGAELISYPPKEVDVEVRNYDEDKKKWVNIYEKNYFSYKLEFKIDNPPFQNKCVINIFPRLIRWVKKPISTRGKECFTPMLLIGDGTYLGEADPVFVDVPIYKREEGKNGRFKIYKNFIDMFEKNQMGEYIPNSNKLQDSPQHYLTEDEKIFVGVPQSTTLLKEHDINNGLSQRERIYLVEKIINVISDKFNKGIKSECLDLYRYEINRDSVFKHMPLTFTDVLKNKTLIEIYYKDSVNIQIMIKYIIDELNLVQLEENKYQCRDNNKIVHIEPIDMKNWQSDIFINKNKEEFINKFDKYLKEKDTPAIAYFELENQKYFMVNKLYDPKYAIRETLFRKNRSSQFFTPIKEKEVKKYNDSLDKKNIMLEKKNQKIKDMNLKRIENGKEPKPLEELEVIKNRICNTSADGIRQLGCYRSDLNTVFKNIEYGNKIAYVGLYRNEIRRNNKSIEIPAVCGIINNQVWIYYQGLKEWMPYHEATIELGKNNYKYLNSKKTDYNFYEKVLSEFELQFRPEHVMVFVEAQNIRNSIKYFANPKINLDQYSFKRGTKEITYKPLKYTIIRCRYGDEVPDWCVLERDKDTREFIVKETTQPPSTIYKVSENLYYLLGGPRVTFGTGDEKSSTKITHPHLQHLKTKAMEMTVINKTKNISNDEIALAVQKMRERFVMSSVNDDKDNTRLPLPLHLLKGLLDDAIIKPGYTPKIEKNEEDNSKEIKNEKGTKEVEKVKSSAEREASVDIIDKLSIF